MDLRQYIDRNIAPHFHKGGRFQSLFTFYEMFDTMLYSRSIVALGMDSSSRNDRLCSC